MSTTVDNRVVQMRFDNEEFEKKATKSLSTLDKLKNALKFSGASKNLDEVDKSFKEIDANPLLKAINGINSGFTTMVAKATIVNRATNALIDTTKKFVNSMTLDQVNAGWDKYAEKTSAVQTIMAATSKDFKDTSVQMGYVNKQLEKLNWFTDETSYNFIDMVGNIGKFTSNGIKLDKSVTAMQGIATWAARSGANANEASRAMYNLSQALSVGAVKLIDWKSIENANMATAEFKENALEAAAALGTLKKKGDGTYVTMKNNAVSVQNFNNALSDAWFTSDVLLNTLNNYGGFTNELYKVSEETGLTATQLLSALDDYEKGTLDLQKYSKETGVSASLLEQRLKTLGSSTYELGRKSFKSAQEAKTFSEAIAATSDAVSTKWMKSFEIIFGDYEEAKVLWTELSNVLYDVFAASLDTRNEILADWKELGGRDDLLEGLRSSLEFLQKAIEPIKDSFRKIFPEKTAIDIFNLTEKFRDFALSLKVTEEYSSTVTRIFNGLFSIVDIGRMSLKALLNGLKSVLVSLKPIGNGLLELLAQLGDSVSAIRNNLKYSDSIGKTFDTLGAGISGFVSIISNALEKLGLSENKIKSIGIGISGVYSILKPIGSTIGNILNQIIISISKIFSSKDGLGSFDTLFSAINIGGSIAIFSKILGLIKSISEPFKSGSGLFKNIKDGIESIGEAVESWKTNKLADTLKTIAISIGVLSASLVVLASINPSNMRSSLTAITTLFIELVGSLKMLESITTGSTLGSTMRLATMLIAMSAAILILSSAVKKMSDIEWTGLIKGLASTATLIIMLSKSMKSFSGGNLEFMKGASGLIAIAVAIRVLANSVKMLSDLGIGDLAKGLVSVSVLLAALAIFSQNAANMKITSGVGFVALATGLVILSQAVKTLSELGIVELAKSLISIGIALAEITIAINAMPKNTIGIGLGLIGISTGILIISKALSNLGSMNISEIGKSLITLGVALTVLIVAANALSGLLTGAASITVLSVALIALSAGLKILGSMKLSEIGKSILALVSVLGIFGAAAFVLTPVIPIMIALAGALALLGVAVVGIGAGILALSVGLGYLSSVASNGIESVISIFKSIIELIPYILEQVGIGLASLAAVIVEHVPEFVNAGLSMILGLMDGIANKLPDIIDCGISIVLNLLRGVRDNISEIVSTGVDVILNFLTGLSSKMADVANAAFDIVITFINAIGSTIKERTPELVTAFINLGKDVVAGLVGGLFSGITSVVNAVKELGSSALSTLRSVFRSHSPSEETHDIGGDYDEGLGNGIDEGKDKVVESATDVASSAVEATRKTLTDGQLEIYDSLVSTWSKRTDDLKSQQEEFLKSQQERQDAADAELLKKQDKINRELKKKWYQRSKDLRALQEETLAAQGKTSKSVDDLTDVLSDTITQATANSSGSYSKSGTKAADAFLTAFETRLSDLDLDLNTLDLEQQLWEATIGKSATDSEKTAKETEILTEKIRIQNEKVDQANQKYEYTVQKLGKTSEDAKKAYQSLLQEQISLANLMDQVNSTRETVSDNSTDAMVAYAQYIAESQDDLLKLGFTMEQISAAAAERTGYNLQNTTQTMTDTVTSAVSTAMNTVSDTYLATAESTLGALNPSFQAYGAEYATSIGNGMTTTTSAVTAGANALAMAGKTAIANDPQNWYTLGQNCAEGFKQGILSKAKEIADAAVSVVNAAFVASQIAIDSHSPSRKFMWLGEMADQGLIVGLKSMQGDVENTSAAVSEGAIKAAQDTIGQIADFIDTDATLHPQISPVVDMSDVQAGFSRINRLHAPTLHTTVTGARVAAVASSLSQRQSNLNQPVPQNNQNGPQNFNFVQNNYSPKALSRTEIYRNTNNQFTAFKEAISKV